MVQSSWLFKKKIKAGCIAVAEQLHMKYYVGYHNSGVLVNIVYCFLF